MLLPDLTVFAVITVCVASLPHFFFGTEKMWPTDFSVYEEEVSGEISHSLVIIVQSSLMRKIKKSTYKKKKHLKKAPIKLSENARVISA